MFSALFAFLGGSAFRMVWGEISAWLQKRQEQQQELERMRLQDQLETGRHQRDMERIRLTAELGIKEVQIKADAALSKAEADAFVEAMRDAFRPTGIALVDIWNGVIRPQFAQLALLLWFAKVVGQGFVMDAYDMELSCAVLGFFVADRSLGRRGK